MTTSVHTNGASSSSDSSYMRHHQSHHDTSADPIQSYARLVPLLPPSSLVRIHKSIQPANIPPSILFEHTRKQMDISFRPSASAQSPEHGKRENSSRKTAA